jgi:hypothetical protein
MQKNKVNSTYNVHKNEKSKREEYNYGGRERNIAKEVAKGTQKPDLLWLP